MRIAFSNEVARKTSASSVLKATHASALPTRYVALLLNSRGPHPLRR